MKKSEKKATLNLSLSQKIGQVLMVGLPRYAGSDTADLNTLYSLIKKHQIGNFILFGSDLGKPDEVVDLLTTIIKASKDANNGIPPFIAIDHEGGRIHRFSDGPTHYPSAKDMGKRLSLSDIKSVSRVMGEELYALGFSMNLAPVLDVSTSARSRVIGDRSFGSDPIWVIQCGRAFLQGQREARIIAVGKHFPGHGSTSIDSHKQLPKLNRTRKEMDCLELLPFKTLIEEGEIDAIMVGHLLFEHIDSLPATLSAKFIDGILRHDLGFKGLVITDDLLMKGLMNGYSLEDATVMAFLSGCDILLVCGGIENWEIAYNAIYKAIKDGRIKEERLDKSVQRIIRYKRDYGLMERHLPDKSLIMHSLQKPSSLLLKEKAEKR